MSTECMNCGCGSKEEEFLRELIELFLAHGIEVGLEDEYDEWGQYDGTSHYFIRKSDGAEFGIWELFP